MAITVAKLSSPKGPETWLATPQLLAVLTRKASSPSSTRRRCTSPYTASFTCSSRVTWRKERGRRKEKIRTTGEEDAEVDGPGITRKFKHLV